MGEGGWCFPAEQFFLYFPIVFITLKNNLWVCLFLGLDDSVVLANDASMISQLNSWLSPKLRIHTVTGNCVTELPLTVGDHGPFTIVAITKDPPLPL